MTEEEMKQQMRLAISHTDCGFCNPQELNEDNIKDAIQVAKAYLKSNQ